MVWQEAFYRNYNELFPFFITPLLKATLVNSMLALMERSECCCSFNRSLLDLKVMSLVVSLYLHWTGLGWKKLSVIKSLMQINFIKFHFVEISNKALLNNDLVSVIGKVDLAVASSNYFLLMSEDFLTFHTLQYPK